MSQQLLNRLFRVGFNASNRIFGLDLLRFIAIMMVVLGHSCLVLPDELASIIHIVLLDGVSIFFVLSGFLIGGILIRQLEKGKNGWGDLFHFWKRRWMRTLPAYLVVLTFILIYTWLVVPHQLPDHWYRFYFFAQNLFVARPDFFAEAWSLSVEEWFYLLIPVVLFGGIYLFRLPSRQLIPLLMLGIILLAIVYRYWLFHSIPAAGELQNFGELKDFGDGLITYRVLPRLDALMFGVLGAYLMHYFPKIWNNNYKIWLFVIGFILLYVTKRDHAMDYTLYDAVWSHSVKSVAVLLLLPFLSGWTLSPNPITRVITFISLISYSMYLVNWKVVLLIIMKNGIYQQYSGSWKLHENWWVDYILFWLITIVLSFLLYRLIETPFMNLRRKEN